ncbi:PP2C family protein-serine/threonine phosphatase [Rhodosalinus sp. FB01]|uniref:PP2C family protein-serine/threonine phosphatase n=1 Tax=Rhodosalinus sp. FB01 TaxID=3239194 RepID=UPI00352638A7
MQVSADSAVAVDAPGGAIRDVLIVDDSRFQRRILRALLSRWGFRVREAGSGMEALALCETQPPDLVLSDWMMPGMSGLAFCRAFHALLGNGSNYFILLPSKREKCEVAEGLDAGADDFLTKPVDPEELRARISAGDRMIAMQRELEEKNRLISETLSALRSAHDAIEEDLRQARRIQQALVPARDQRFGRASVSVLLRPCGHVGGDLVGAFTPGQGLLGLYAIDVSGHGITSALMTARVAGYLSANFPDQNLAMERGPGSSFVLRPPEEVASALNDRLLAEAGIEQYFTMLYATVDTRDGAVRLVQAGHPHPLILRASGTCEMLGAGGLPVGLVGEARFERVEARLGREDRLLVCSDGVTECRLAGGGMLGDDGLIALATEVAGSGARGSAFLDALYERLLRAMPDGVDVADDVSAVLLELDG